VTVGQRPLRELVQALAAPARREDAAVALAAATGVQRVVLYVKDPALEVMLPAPGMPKTIAGGARWRALLARCLAETRPTALVDLPAGSELDAHAICADGAALILLGGAPQPAALEQLALEFPLLAALLVAQQALHIERAEAAEARLAATRSHALALALDTARAASAELNLQLQREHERKDEFLAMLAHELRNPLSPLVNSIAILQRRVGGEDELLTRQLAVMSRQLQQLTHLVDDLLDVSRVSRGLIELRRERLVLDEVLNDAIEAARPAIEHRGHLLQRSMPAAPVLVYGDRVRLTQVFANLLGNAAKYTDPGGRLALSVIPDQHRVSVVVQDSGIGIPQDMLGRVFDMFTQVPSSLARSQGGLGIGLTLVRRLVELHGGRVSAYSRGAGAGSTFTVSLPQLVERQMPGPAPQPPREQPPPERAAAAGAPPLVLVVDDNCDAADTLAEVMNCMGADARVARDGSEALRLVPQLAPDLVLLDIGLPGLDGYETARQLRLQPGFHARLVALTGYGSALDRQRALAAGFDEHLVKPLSPEAAQRLLDALPAMQAGS
jgi:signal transduction histidine kinase/ActR/RegA family two-component response regulator